MYQYKNDNYFLKLVESKNTKQIKGEIANLLLKYRGDKSESDAAIEYAKSQGTFKWDTHDGKEIPSHANLLKDKFNYEKGALKRNFSEVRYERVLKLLKEYLKEREPEVKEIKSIRKDPLQQKSIRESEKISGGKGPEITGRKKNPDINQKKGNPMLPVLIILTGLIVIVALILQKN